MATTMEWISNMVRVKAERAAALVEEGKVARSTQPGMYIVSGKADYAVDLNRQHCTCPDHARRDSFCKHLMAATLYQGAGRKRA